MASVRKSAFSIELVFWASVPTMAETRKRFVKHRKGSKMLTCAGMIREAFE